MGRKAKYANGQPVGTHGLVLLHRTSFGSNPKGLFRYPDGREREHYVSDVAANKITGQTFSPMSADYEPGAVVGEGFKYIGPGENGKSIFERDGKQIEKRFSDVFWGRYSGAFCKHPTYKEGDEVGSYGALFVEYTKRGKAIFEWPSGEMREHYVSSVERGSATGGERGRPRGRKTDWLTKKLVEGAKANARQNRTTLR